MNCNLSVRCIKKYGQYPCEIKTVLILFFNYIEKSVFECGNAYFLVAVLCYPRAEYVVGFIIHVCHCICMRNDALCFACKNFFTVEVKLPFYRLACCLLSFSKVVEVTTEHSSVIGGKLFEDFEFFGNFLVSRLKPVPHNYAVEKLKSRAEFIVNRLINTELMSVEYHPGVKSLHVIIMKSIHNAL